MLLQFGQWHGCDANDGPFHLQLLNQHAWISFHLPGRFHGDGEQAVDNIFGANGRDAVAQDLPQRGAFFCAVNGILVVDASQNLTGGHIRGPLGVGCVLGNHGRKHARHGRSQESIADFIDRHRLTFSVRRPLYKNWLYLEVAPELQWRNDSDWKTIPILRIGAVAMFWGFGQP